MTSTRRRQKRVSATTGFSHHGVRPNVAISHSGWKSVMRYRVRIPSAFATGITKCSM